MSRTPDYILDVNGLRSESAPPAQRPTGGGGGSLKGRPWLAVYWRCCHAYSRIYRNRQGTAYVGRCPGCGKHVHAAVGPDGTDCRMFFAE